MKTSWQDPLSGEIISPDIAGLQEAVGKIEDVLDMNVVSATNVPLTEIFISENDRYRIYQAEGKRNWVGNPVPVIKVNGTPISTGFTINYGGGAVIFEPPLTVADVVTADFSYVMDVSNTLDTHTDVINTHLSATAANNVHGLLGKIIEESGSNSNGRYIKFDDGTAIAYLSKDRIASETAIDCGNIPYPLTFTTTPIITTSKSEPNSQTWSGNIHVGIIGPSTARIVISNVISGNTYRYNLMVIGRWK